MPSKKVREDLIDGLNRWLQLPEMSLNRIRNIVVMLHTAALMYRIFLRWQTWKGSDTQSQAGRY